MTLRLQMYFLFLFISFLVNGQDIIRKTFCWNQDFRLDCQWSSILAIHEAYFTNDVREINQSDCTLAAQIKSRIEEPCTEDVKSSLNKRCSGMSHCHYNMTQDHHQRQCYCRGVIVLRYACVPESYVTQSCNTKIIGASGYITSPGYPRFYPKVPQCVWTLEDSKGEEISLEILDMDTRIPVRRKPFNFCPDSLTIFEDFHKLRYICGPYNNETKKPVQTSGKKVHLEFTSLDFMPSRGFLLYYKVLGCATLPPPKLGYMVYRNKSTALYMCCKDHVFNDTLSNVVFLQCIDEMRWNGTITPCISLAELEGKNGTQLDEVKLEIVEVYLSRNKYIEEVLIPTACVVGLVFGHAAAILLILKIKKKRKTSGSTHLNNRPQATVPLQPPLPPSAPTLPPSAPTLPPPPVRSLPLPPVPSFPPPPLPPVIKQPPQPTVSTIPMAPRVLITDL